MYIWPETSPECVLYSLLRTKEAAKIQRTKQAFGYWWSFEVPFLLGV